MSPRRFKQVDVFTARPFLATRGRRAGCRWVGRGTDAGFCRLDQSLGDDVRPSPTAPGAITGCASSRPRASCRLQAIDDRQRARRPRERHGATNTARMNQECGAGLLPIRIEDAPDGRRIFVKAPQPKIRGGDSALKQQAEMALRARLSDQSRPLLVDVGPVWLVAELADAAAVHGLAPDMAAIAQLSLDLSIAGITAFGLTGRQPDAVYTRSFAPAFNVPEDPVCGSGQCERRGLSRPFREAGGNRRDLRGSSGERSRSGRPRSWSPSTRKTARSRSADTP